MQAAYAIAHLQPQATTIDAELRDGVLGIVDDHWPVDDIATNGMHTRSEDQVGLLTVWESQSQGIHVTGIWRDGNLARHGGFHTRTLSAWMLSPLPSQ
jgi:hypothetical protein